MSTDTEPKPKPGRELDVYDPRLSRFELVREGARRDGVEVVHYAPRVPVPGTRAERRIERTIALLFLIAGAAANTFVVVFAGWDLTYRTGSGPDKLYTPLLGGTLGLALLAVALAFITWGKKLLPEEVAVQDRHVGPSPPDEQRLTAATMTNMVVDEIGITRRPLLLKAAIALGLLPLGGATVVVLGALIKDPHKDELLLHTGWDPKNNDGQPVPLAREDGSRIRPEEVSVSGQMTVFPGIPGGATNKWADSPVLLIHLREQDAVAGCRRRRLRGNVRLQGPDRTRLLGAAMRRRKVDVRELPAKTAVGLDERLQAAGLLRRTFNKVFPDHWSFLLGEIALYSFIVLLLTGTFLALFFDPSMEEVPYNGSYTPLRGIMMSRAYATSLDISFDVRGGLIMRQMHHWAALLFMAAIVVHMMRIFFTGAFRKPRELNWIIGLSLFWLGFTEGFAGYSLPDDALSGTGLRIANAIVQSIPLIGTCTATSLLGGEFPGMAIVPRLYILHVFLLPGINQ